MATITPEAPKKREDKYDSEYDDEFNRHSLSKEEQANLLSVRERNQDDVDFALGRNKEESEGGKDIQEQEKQGAPYLNNYTSEGQSKSWRKRFTGFLTGSKKGPTALIATSLILLVFGGTSFFGLTLGPIAYLANVGLDLNDPLSAVEKRTESQLKDKIRNTKSGADKVSLGCTTIAGASLPIKCKMKTVSPWLEEKLKNAGIEIEGKDKIGGRILPEKYIFTDSKGEVHTYLTAEDFAAAVKGGNPELWRNYRTAINSNWLSMKGKNFVKGVLAKYSLDQSPKELTGTAEERAKELANGKEATALGEGFTQIANAEDGSERWQDGAGNVYTTDQKNTAEKGSTSVRENLRPLGQASISTLEKVNVGINVIGYFDAACTIRNLVGSGTIAAKVSNSAQLAAYAMELTPIVGKLQAGDNITPEDAQAVQKFFNDTDARKTIGSFVASKTDNASASVGEVTNPHYGENALDSPLYQMSAGGGVAQTGISEANYSLGFGTGSLLKSGAANLLDVSNAISKIKSVDGCDYIQSKVVRTAGIIVGGGLIVVSAVGCVITLGIGCGGVALEVAKTAGTIAAFTIGTAIVTRHLNAALSGTLISDTMDQAPVDRGSALWTGMSVLYSTSSQMRGMMPGSSDQIVAYQKEQNVARHDYIAMEREASSPLDINNPYSVTGSIAYSLYNHLPKSSSGLTVASLFTGLSSFVSSGLSSAINPDSAFASSVDSDRFKQCDDDGYKDIGIDADVQCNVRYVMPEESMQWDSLDVAQWMEDNGFVKPDTDTGYPEGYSRPEPSKVQEGAMNMIKGAAKGVFEGLYGVSKSYEDKYDKPYEGLGQRPDGGDLKGAKYAKFLDYCVYRALPFGNTYEEGGALGDIGADWLDGKACRNTEDNDINHFRAYIFDITVNDDLDGPVLGNINCGPFGSNSGGSVGGKMTEAQLMQQIPTYGLPAPKADSSPELIQYGEPVKGYTELLEQLKANPKAAWAAQGFLNGEKQWKAAGGDIKEYLTTAWVWFETGQEGWPDPYQANCHDTEGSGTAYQFCGSMYQVGGAQLRDHNGQITDIFNKIYKGGDLPSVLEKVYENSSNAAKSEWDYHQDKGSLFQYADSRKSATVADLSPQSSFDSQKTQFLTTLLAKDPAVAAALNSFAVSDSDLVVALKGSGYGYIGEPARQQLSNMMMALYMFDGSGPADGASCSDGGAKVSGGGAGISVVWGGVGDRDLSYGLGSDAGLQLYSYGIGMGLGGTGTLHTGVDVPGEPEDPIYAPIDGLITCSGTGSAGIMVDGTECNAFNDYMGKGNGRIEIKTDSGDIVILGHTSTGLVKVGDRVKIRQQVGTVGGMNGYHTHVEVRVKDPSVPVGWRLVDPIAYFKGGT